MPPELARPVQNQAAASQEQWLSPRVAGLRVEGCHRPACVCDAAESGNSKLWSTLWRQSWGLAITPGELYWRASPWHLLSEGTSLHSDSEPLARNEADGSPGWPPACPETRAAPSYAWNQIQGGFYTVGLNLQKGQRIEA
ncbi:hypothetical protein NDU88_001130 [Pleurodeles waltl]|uniref:Uncharacterized protein n=1 Tax=Pleurodeles waltl TaxID=8319 RepID=A0AAV7THW4_PLEWA|nr:hypothetical protein NDU88_001130 [Pleurodeles waltl]